MTYHPSNTDPHAMSDGDVADALGRVKAEMADLQEVEDALKRALIDRGVEEAEGQMYRATVSPARVDFRLDTRSVREEMGEQWCNARSRHVHVGPSVRVGARGAGRRKKAA